MTSGSRDSERQDPERLDLDAACRVMHDAYETVAPSQGWRTQEASAKPWDAVPPANQNTMRHAVAALIGWMSTLDGEQLADLAAEAEEWWSR